MDEFVSTLLRWVEFCTGEVSLDLDRLFDDNTLLTMTQHMLDRTGSPDDTPPLKAVVGLLAEFYERSAHVLFDIPSLIDGRNSDELCKLLVIALHAAVHGPRNDFYIEQITKLSTDDQERIKAAIESAMVSLQVRSETATPSKAECIQSRSPVREPAPATPACSSVGSKLLWTPPQQGVASPAPHALESMLHLRRQVTALQSELADTQILHDQAMADLEEKTSKLEALQFKMRKHEGIESEMLQLQDELDDLRAKDVRRERLEREVEELRARAAAISDQEQSVAELTRQRDELLLALENYEQHESQSEQVTRQQRLITKTQESQIAELKASLQRRENEVTLLIKERNTAKQSAEDLRRQLIAQEAKAREDQAAQDERHSEAITALTQRISLLQSQNAKLLDQVKELGSYKRKNADLMAALDTMEEKQTLLRVKLDKAEDNVATYRSELEAAKTSLEHTAKEREELQHKHKIDMARAQREVNNLMQALQATSGAVDNMTQLQNHHQEQDAPAAKKKPTAFTIDLSDSSRSAQMANKLKSTGHSGKQINVHSKKRAHQPSLSEEMPADTKPPRGAAESRQPPARGDAAHHDVLRASVASSKDDSNIGPRRTQEHADGIDAKPLSATWTANDFSTRNAPGTPTTPIGNKENFDASTDLFSSSLIVPPPSVTKLSNINYAKEASKKKRGQRKDSPKNYYKPTDKDRLQEFERRNAQVKPHMRSSYFWETQKYFSPGANSTTESSRRDTDPTANGSPQVRAQQPEDVDEDKLGQSQTKSKPKTPQSFDFFSPQQEKKTIPKRIQERLDAQRNQQRRLKEGATCLGSTFKGVKSTKTMWKHSDNRSPLEDSGNKAKRVDATRKADVKSRKTWAQSKPTHAGSLVGYPDSPAQ